MTLNDQSQEAYCIFIVRERLRTDKSNFRYLYIYIFFFNIQAVT